MHQAVLAARVLARLPVFPIDAAPELFPASVVAALDEIAWALPAFGRAGRGAPRRTRVLAQPGRELQEQRRRRDRIALGQRQHAAELPMDLVAVHEMVAGHLLVSIAG